MDPLTESIKFAKDIHLRELKRFLIRVFGNPLLGSLEAFLVFCVQLQTHLEFLNQRLAWLVPHADQAQVCHIVFTSRHHLVGDLKMKIIQ